jgi:succinate dehydrogenase/fumarate reductase flavoprotein subunit
VSGERFVERYYSEVKTGIKAGQEFLDFYHIADAMTREVDAGRGPIYIDFRKLTDEERSVALQSETLPARFQPPGRGDLLKAIREKLGLDPDMERIEVELQFVGGQGPIKIDLDCKTTVDGLWAVGDASSLGSGFTGARASGTFGGFSIAFATVSGLRGGQSAGRSAIDSGPAEVDSGEVKRLKEKMLAPHGRHGDIDVNEVVYQIHEAMIPVKYNLHREADRLREALGKIDTARDSLAKAGAKDHHELSRYHQAESMALSAGWTLSAALMRQETRGTQHREDYPGRDDKNWLKWIVIKEEEGRPRFFTEPVPVEKYVLKPRG